LGFWVWGELYTLGKCRDEMDVECTENMVVPCTSRQVIYVTYLSLASYIKSDMKRPGDLSLR
jgi:hypothetical protein